MFRGADSLRTVVTDAVVVTGSRQEIEASRAPVAVEVIGAGRMQRAGTTNLQTILQEQSIVATRSSLQTGVQLMGMSADYTQILLDGLPLVGRVAGVIDISRIATGNVEQIEVVKGPMSSLYGSEALAGVINLRSQRPVVGWSARWQALWQSIQGFQTSVTVGYGGEKVEWTLFTDIRKSPAFEQRSDTLVVPYAGFTDMTIQSKARARLSSTWDMEVNGRMFRSVSEGRFVETFFTQVAANRGSVSQSDVNGAMSANYRSGNLHVLMQVYGTRFSERYEFDVAQGSAGTVDEYGRSLVRPFLQANVLVSDRIRCTLGTEVAFDAVRGSRYPSDPSYRTSVVYGQWEGNPVDRLHYSLSARYDANSEFGDNLNPKLAVMVEPIPQLRLRGSVGTGFKAPDFRQLYVVFRNNLQGAGYVLTGARLVGEDLKAERSLSADVSLSYDAAYATHVDSQQRLYVHADIRAFENRISEMIEFYLWRIEGQTAVYSYRNVSRVRTRGMETNVRFDVVTDAADSLLMSMGYQYLRAEDLSVVDAISAGRAGSIDRSTGTFLPLSEDAYGGLWYRSTNMWNARCEIITRSGFTLSIRADFVGRFGDEALDRNGSVLSQIVRVVPDDDREYARGYWNVKVNAWMNLSSLMQTTGVTTFRVGIGGTNLLDQRDLRSVPS
ncbi:MAG: TonB-dependent receptor plug domain-containing protein, partial [Candidatus Kapaibacterium sp.]